MDVAPFRGVRYNPAVAGDPATTSAPAEDELEPLTYAAHRTASPYTVMELMASGERGYAGAAETLRRWRRTGVLVTDPSPALYLYEEHELRHGVPAVQRGVLGAVALEPLVPGASILAHEQVDPARVRERLEHLTAVSLDLAPIYTLAFGTPPALHGALDRPPAQAPLVAATDERGVDHRIWRLSEERSATVRELLREVRVVIADGHHRYAGALAFAERCRAQAAAPGDPPWRRTLAYIVDATQRGPEIRAVHRLVRPLPATAIDRLAELFTVTEAPGDVRSLLEQLDAEPAPAFGLLLPGETGFLLRARNEAVLRAALSPERSARWRQLDAAVLTVAVLPRLGVRPDQVRERADALAAAREVDAGGPAGLFLLRPVTLDTVAALAMAGEPMPPKTTWFRPKPRTGLLMRDVLGYGYGHATG